VTTDISTIPVTTRAIRYVAVCGMFSIDEKGTYRDGMARVPYLWANAVKKHNSSL